MGLTQELTTEVSGILRSQWQSRNGNVVPTPETVRLGDNEGVNITGTVLYADINGSTRMVDRFNAQFCAEVYKSYLHCAGKIIRSESGVITAYDGDRVMAVYISETMHDQAVRSAMKIAKAVESIINPLIKNIHGVDFQLRQSIGIDTSNLFVVRTGVRGATDLVWVGRAANYAAKMSAISDPPFQVFISHPVYDGLSQNCRMYGDRNMWFYQEGSDKRIIKTSYVWYSIG
jgi:class 3 adenylate cyclase